MLTGIERLHHSGGAGGAEFATTAAHHPHPSIDSGRALNTLLSRETRLLHLDKSGLAMTELVCGRGNRAGNYILTDSVLRN